MSRTDYAKTLLLASVFVVFTAMKHCGFVILLLSPVFLISFIYSAIQMRRKPDERKRRTIQIVIWLGAVVFVGTVHWYWAYSARTNANAALAAVLLHDEKTGSYPETLEELGLNEQDLGRKWMLGYSLRQGRPFLFYGATFTPFESFGYDFGKREWQYNPD